MSDIARGEKPDWWDDLEDGTREDALVSNEAERVYLRAPNHEGEMRRYWFDVKDLTWTGKNKYVSDALKIGEEKTELRIDQYYKDVLEAMIQDSSVDGSLSIFLAGVSPELGQKLQDLAPRPGDALENQEAKNSDEPFAAGVREGEDTTTLDSSTTSGEQ
ncbi:hypothetical protein [Natronosalvus rutilus]|uniref:Uncharacterized protein n=1 Tax=Natronosalvus rutilus TaxID=2953753 RepID=A0A9E7NCY2_9EURY|nr:hypothetical protein [Natronosalvus rutilus]UTF55982.1 hypothetical protein NGM29_21045 [Natronosalvus rutilus]